MKQYIIATVVVVALGLLIYLVVPRKHVVDAVAPAYDLLTTPTIPFEDPGSMELDGVWIENIMPRWKQDEEMLFFSHIPRTSGGTMLYILNATFPNRVHPASSEGRPIHRFYQFKETPAHMWPFYKALCTHEDWSFINFIPYPTAMVVWIREPADNRRSIYDSQGVFRRWASGKYPHISEWIGSPDYPRNYQVEWVAGATNYWPYSKATGRYVEFMTHSPDDLLRRAKENLARTVFLGITDRHNESTCLFFYSMRLTPKIEGVDWRSVHKIASNKVSEVLREKQKPFLLLEYELYQFAVDLFEARLAWMRRDFAANRAQTIDFVGPDCHGVLY